VSFKDQEFPLDLDSLLNEHFQGRVVRKDLTKLLKEGANVPVYVLEYLLGMYCASSDEELIQEGLETVKRILSENYVRPDEAEKIKSKVRELGNYKIIDKVTVRLNERRDVYEAMLSNLGVKGIEIPSATIKKYEKLLAGGIWCIISLQYFYEENKKSSPFIITELRPIQMPNLDMDALFEGRRAFTVDQWIDVLLRSTGLEPTALAAELNHTQDIPSVDLAHIVPTGVPSDLLRRRPDIRRAELDFPVRISRIPHPGLRLFRPAG